MLIPPLLKRKLTRLLQKGPFVKTLVALGLTDLLLNLYWRKRNPGEWNSIAETGLVSTPPSSVHLEATMRCNLNCMMCHQKELRRAHLRELTKEEMFKAIDQIASWHIPLIEMTGGEVFIRKDIIDIIEYIDAQKITLKLNNNGTLINSQHMDALKKCNYFESIAFSIDGPPEIHNMIRGNNKAFNTTCNNIKALGRTGFLKNICFVLMPENAKYIEEMFKLAHELRINRLLFMAEMFNLPEAEMTSRTMLSLGPEDTIYMEKKSPPPPPDYAEIMQSAYRQIIELRKKYKILAPLYPALSQRKSQEFFNRKYSGRLICKAMKSLIISVDGNVYVCPFIHCKVGNVLEEPITEIWNNEKMRRIRRTILQNRTMLPICHSCCNIEEL